MSKKLAVILSCTILAAACGNSGETKSAETKDTASAAPAASAATSSANEKGLELIGASDCTTCHRLQKDASGASIGPAYSEVAAKYSPAADTTVDRLVKKIIAGGSGVWGTVPMTPHPSVPEADVRTMVKYILSLKK
ncbi:MAG TPA: c-type cytochrome [Puia sp.]